MNGSTSMNDGSSARELNARHWVGGTRWVDGPGGPMLEVSTDRCEARVSAYGAQVATWTPAGHRPGLFLSPRTAWGGGKAIRGGIPVCWPWFGNRVADPQPSGKPSPAHGFARTRPWRIEGVLRETDGRIQVAFTLGSSDDTLALWPHVFAARLVASLGETLEVALEVENVGAAPLEYEAALHAYLAVSNVENVTLAGLDGARYVDKVDGGQEKEHRHELLTLDGETDRVFLGTESTVVIEDPGWQRSVVVEKRGSDATVVWNPWLAKASAMTDLGSEAWRSFVCVEAARVRPNPVSLAPGATHAMSTRIEIRPAPRRQR